MIPIGTIATLKQRKDFFLLYGIKVTKFKGRMIYEACPKCGKCRWVQPAKSGCICTDCNRGNRLIHVDGYEILNRLEYFERFGVWKTNSQILFPCSKCGKKLWISRSYIEKKNFIRICKSCSKGGSGLNQYRYPERSREYREKNKDRIKEMKRLYSIKNREKILEKSRIYYLKNKEKHALRAKIYNEKNKERLLVVSKKYRKEHSEEIVARVNKWTKENPKKANANKKKHKKKKLSTLKGALDNRMSHAIRLSLKSGKNGKSWTSLVDFNIQQLMEHLIMQFTDGMTIELLIAGKIHIDHKMPIVSFNYDSPDDVDFKKCWSLENLQPLWARDNLRKGSKIIY
jgi:hypothetical protein